MASTQVVVSGKNDVVFGSASQAVLLRASVGLLVFLALLIGALDAWVGRHFMNADGVSYIEVAEAYLRGDWHSAINGYWSPLYSWILVLGLSITRPSPYWEFPFVHLVNFVIYCFSLACLHFFLIEVIRYQKRVGTLLGDHVLAPNWSWIALGYPLFIWSSIQLIGLAVVTPDMCAGGFVYLAAGLCIRALGEPRVPHRHLFYLGFVLGMAYLAKGAMLFFAGTIGVVGVSSIRGVRSRLVGAAVMFAGFVLAAGPFITALSINKGRLTLGDTGKLNYAWYAGGAKRRHWQREVTRFGEPRNPTEQIYEKPAIYEFSRPFNVTYGPWYDPSFWFEGLKIRFRLDAQINAVRNSLDAYREIYSRHASVLIALTVASAVLYLMGWACRTIAAKLSLLFQLSVPAVVMLIIYSIVHVESRFLASFVVLFWTGIFSGVVLPASRESRRLLGCSAVVVATIVLAAMIMPVYQSLYATARDVVRGEGNSPDETWKVAKGLSQIGLRPGDHVAIIGWGTAESSWARSARLRIVAEIPSGGWGFRDGDLFWTASEEEKAKVYHALALTGAKALVAHVPNSVSSQGWQNIENTDHSVLFLEHYSTMTEGRETLLGTMRRQFSAPMLSTAGFIMVRLNGLHQILHWPRSGNRVPPRV